MSFFALTILLLSYTPYLILRRQPDFVEENFEKELFDRLKTKSLNGTILSNSFNTYFISNILWLPFCIVIYCCNFYWNSAISITELFFIVMTLTAFVIGRKPLFIMFYVFFIYPTYTCVQLWKILLLNKKEPQDEIV
ncbi:unnamed protein product [Mucor hiemalis]